MPGKLQKFYFMFKKFKKDITRDRQIYEIGADLHGPELKEYYFIMTEAQMLSGHSQQYQFDEKGIPIIPSYIDVEKQEMLYYPISIGQYGLAIWDTFLKTGSEEDKTRFLNIAEWFYQNRIENETLGCYWLTYVDKPAYQIKSPWKSAFSQARAINILMRAFQLTGKKEYQEISRKALTPFLLSVTDGGVTTFTNAGPFMRNTPRKCRYWY